MNISEVSIITELTEYTLRYYEKEGLIKNIKRISGIRNYNENDILWIEFIKRLKETGMTLKNIKKYSDLRHLGDSTLSERKLMLIEHKKKVMNNISMLEQHLEHLDTKIEIYIKKETEYEQIRKRD